MPVSWILGVAWAVTAMSSPSSPADDAPHIILILADDVGVEAFGSYGGSSYATPRLDALARAGMRFTHAYSQPLCTPSRVKLLTGRSNLRNYVHFSILDRREVTFGQLLRGAGYRTAVAGKWQLYGAESYGEWAGKGTHPRDAGFESWCLWQIDALGSRYWNPRIERDGKQLTELEQRYGPDVFCEFILSYMKTHRDERFCIFYPMALVHSPFRPTPASTDRESTDRQRNFADMMTHMDTVIGRIVDGLEALKLERRTLVLFTSDNGTHRKIVSVRNGQAVQGGKGLSTDAGTHVPLIAWWPGKIAPGSTCDDLVDFSDILPTLVELGGAKLPDDRIIDGRSFAPQLLGQPGDPRPWIFCYSNPRPEREKFPRARFARDRRFKLHADGRFYDVPADPLEQRPLALEGLEDAARKAHAKLVAALASMPVEPERIPAAGQRDGR